MTATPACGDIIEKLTDADVIAAIRAHHLKGNTSHFEREPERWGRLNWDRAWVDPGGTIFGPGPYLHVAIEGGEWDGTVQRVHAPARLRRRLAARWTYTPAPPSPSSETPETRA